MENRLFEKKSRQVISGIAAPEIRAEGAGCKMGVIIWPGSTGAWVVDNTPASV
jgi:hypothetical protein